MEAQRTTVLMSKKKRNNHSDEKGKEAKNTRKKSSTSKQPNGATQGTAIDLKEMEASRKSLLEVAVEIAKKRAPTRASRLVYTATRGANDGTEEFHKKWRAKNATEDQITGFATLISGTIFLHVVEAPMKVVAETGRKAGPLDCARTHANHIHY
mmetsp:Transcript_25402/g.35404  ORF Transcript_25402/g.35404 Transcript_25402/m.35404 type:complete len:154 (-) Transcript_25402:19-480(-)